MGKELADRSRHHGRTLALLHGEFAGSRRTPPSHGREVEHRCCIKATYTPIRLSSESDSQGEIDRCATSTINGAAQLASAKALRNMGRTDIRIHDLAWAKNELWVVNTRFSCLATLDDEHSFVPRWRPSFVTKLAAEIKVIVANPEVRERFYSQGIEPVYAGPEEFTGYIKSSVAKYAKVIKTLGLKVD